MTENLHTALFVEQRDHRIFRVWIELSAVRFGQIANISRKFNRRDLHTQAKAEKG